MKFGERLMSLLTPEWRKQYIEYNRLKKMIYDAVEKAPAPEETESREQYFAKFDERFFSDCDAELKKIGFFYRQKLAESQRKLYEISTDLERWKSFKSHPPQKSEAEQAGLLGFLKKPPDSEELQAKTKDQLKLAYSEFYLSLALLQNYQTLNSTGFRKILKKRDKLIGNSRGMEWRVNNVEKAPYHLNQEVNNMIQEVENVYISVLEGGDRSQGMKRLRVPPLEEEQSAWTTFRLGLFTGCFFILSLLILLSIIRGTYVMEEPRWLGVRLFRGLFILFVNVVLIGINMYGWRKAGVNHVLIFEIDPRQHLTYQSLMEVGFLFLMLWALAVLGFLYGPVMGLPPLVFPPLLLCLSLFWMFYPFAWPAFMIRKSRSWFLRHVFVCFTAPFHFVHFPDFWLADQMNSLVTVFLDLEYFFCFYATEVDYSNGTLHAIPTPANSTLGIDFETGEDLCRSNMYAIRPIVSIIPALIRFLQCWRRFRDTHYAHPHISNAMKYSTSFFVVLFGALSTWYKSVNDLPSTNSPFFFLWLLAYVLSFAYTYFWDVKMDWGLMEHRHKYLRGELVYKRRCYYYGAIATDAVLRLSWVLNVSLGDAWTGMTDILLCFTGPLECVRRFVWNYFRLENEHLNNCGQFRAVRDISIKPLKFGDVEEIIRLIDDSEGVTHRGSQLSKVGPKKRKAKGDLKVKNKSFLVRKIQDISSRRDVKKEVKVKHKASTKRPLIGKGV